ncbi:hypothetical protein Rvan_1459 [Rhodomicrobium vannielii ATCC 17100]|uniref:Ribbon-helix-helix protein CopG domain-containing protein n=1 Tax=Rhodomicrobium vannielii (strain ATCC 17100 / DSM 162 / LMG 4299 / NCIMB 10020 / ATH 3.1.1) TaxID=648757 RepID=E3I763_RHOVT|nr:hypothetical protein Rvan_1459 [Rhodomicrobium vannielii ATCC 17100]
MSSAPPTSVRPAAKLVKLSVEVPDYVMKKLKQRALDEERSLRAVVLRALHQHGIEVAENDFIDDGRRKERIA